MGFSDEDTQAVVSAVFEACVNALTHGLNAGEGKVTLCVRTYPDRFEAVIRDPGKGFTYPAATGMPPPGSHRGRGIPLMRAFMDDVRIEFDGGCKETLIKYLPTSGRR